MVHRKGRDSYIGMAFEKLRFEGVMVQAKKAYPQIRLLLMQFRNCSWNQFLPNAWTRCDAQVSMFALR